MMKHRSDPRQVDQFADGLNSVAGVNIAASRARSVTHNALYAASAFFFLQSTGSLSIIDRSVYGEWDGKTGDKITLTLNLLSITASLFLFWSGTRESRIARFNRLLPLGVASLLLISVLWSVDPRVTLTQGAAYFFVVLGAIGIAEALDCDVLMDLVASISGLCAVASVVQFFMFPEPDVLFRGIFAQKNLLGQAMAVGVLTALHGMGIRGGRRFRCICIIALCTCVAFMSKSATSILTIAVFFCLYILRRIYLKGSTGRTISIYLGLGSIPIVIFLITDPDLIFDLMGKDSSLTGRSLIWPYVIDQISEKPLLGWGYSAFWSSVNPLAWQISKAVAGDNWWIMIIPNAHNGMLEMLLAIGFLGTLFFIFLLGRNFVMAIKCMNGPAPQIGLSSVLLLIGILITGVSEQVLVAAQQPSTSLFFVMGFFCEKKLWLTRLARRQGMATPTARRNMRASDRLGLPKRPRLALNSTEDHP
jgi:exopolysaccharide production protein ExoQ